MQSSWVHLAVNRAVGGWFTGGPDVTSATEYRAPPPTSVTPVTPGTTTARVRLVVVPSPTCPLSLLPHAIRLPFAIAARPVSRPEPTDTAVVTPITGTGRVRIVVVPSPSSSR